MRVPAPVLSLVSVMVGILVMGTVALLWRYGEMVDPAPALIAGVATAEATPAPAPDATPTDAPPAATALAAVIQSVPTAAFTPASTATGTATPTPPPAAPPFPLAPIVPPEGSLPYVSSAAPYAIAYPASWSVQPGISQGQASGDAFVEIAPLGPFRSSVTVLAAPLPAAPAAEVRTDARMGELRGKGAWKMGQYPVAGTLSSLLSYEDAQGGTRVAVVEAYFTTSGVAWTATLTTLPERTDKDAGTLLWMLDRLALRR